MRKLKVLFLPLKTVERIWQDSVIEAIGDRHDLRIYDDSKPITEQFEGIEVVIDTGGSVGTHQMYDTAKDVRLWQIHGTGLDHVDVDYMKTKNFMISNCPGQFSSTGLAECAFMYIIMLSRRYNETRRNFNNQILYKPTAKELSGQTLGIIGFGASGQDLALMAKPFGMKIMGIDVRKIEDEVLEKIEPVFMGTPDDIDKVVAESDFVSLHLHLNDQTRHILDARRIALMKPKGCIINVSRGDLVDEEAMHKALLESKIGGAGLDVFFVEPPDPSLEVYQLPNVIVTPHTSGVTEQTAKKRANASAGNVDRIAQGLEPLYRVDL